MQNNGRAKRFGVKAFRQWFMVIALQIAAEWDEGREIYGHRPTPEYPKPPRPKRKHVLRAKSREPDLLSYSTRSGLSAPLDSD
ncbi:hypothetical protein M5D96_006108 [Drosophila gunungcola]|uniref:Uncharacterized protein n=1 Tax=Drosophila gunungcola TaxID=103775 RepID=A0A9Q0BS65_9MUSC|nr:hypothetical protein M5D96_006108 [Drosophila gunungcola]